MIQLILGGITLPETSKDRYSCYPSELSQTVEMISGRLVKEIRGKVQMIEWSYDYMGNDMLRNVLAVLRSGEPVECQYLPDDGADLRSGKFWVQKFTRPTFAFSKGGTPYWHNVSFVLREVKPHD